MTDQFQASLYRDLDQKLKASAWASGVSEAHGLLAALACRGVASARIRGKAHLLRLTAPAEMDLIEGLYDLILRDLTADGFAFNLLLADGDSQKHKTESLADWCGGFLQGFFYDARSGGELDGVPDAIRESIDDILKISRLHGDDGDDDDADTETHLTEIEEYVRVAVQVIFEELNPRSPDAIN